MGAGIAEVFARSRLRRHRRRGRRGRPSTAAAGTSRGRPRAPSSAASSPRTSAPRLWGGSGSPPTIADLSDRDLVIEAVPEDLDLKRAIFEELDRVVPAAGAILAHEHLVAVGDRHRGGHRSRPDAGRRHALLQPGAGARRSSRSCAPWSPTRTSSTTSRRLARVARQAARRRRRPGRLHRQRAALRLPQPRRHDVRDAVRHPRGHRRGDAAGLRPTRWVRWRCST